MLHCIIYASISELCEWGGTEEQHTPYISQTSLWPAIQRPLWSPSLSFTVIPIIEARGKIPFDFRVACLAQKLTNRLPAREDPALTTTQMKFYKKKYRYHQRSLCEVKGTRYQFRGYNSVTCYLQLMGWGELFKYKTQCPIFLPFPKSHRTISIFPHAIPIAISPSVFPLLLALPHYIIVHGTSADTPV